MAITDEEIEEIAIFYAAWTRGSGYDEANDRVRNVVVGRDPEDGWRMLLALCRTCEKDQLGHVAAGPFENWCSPERARQFEARFVAEIAANRKFRYMARGAWDLPGEFATALARAPWEDGWDA